MNAAEQLRDLPRNSRWYAAYWIVSGERHPQEHWYISERLTKWRQQATDRREELQATAQSILAKFDRECTAEARPARAWVMPIDLDGADLAGADKIDAGAHAAVAGERKDRPRYHSIPVISECAQTIEVPRENLISQKRAYHRRAVPRGTGRWAQKRLLRTAA